ncbi:MAG: hypothetical protein ACPG80_05010, partial [Rickettsiales bacterium]
MALTEQEQDTLSEIRATYEQGSPESVVEAQRMFIRANAHNGNAFSPEMLDDRFELATTDADRTMLRDEVEANFAKASDMLNAQSIEAEPQEKVSARERGHVFMERRKEQVGNAADKVEGATRGVLSAIKSAGSFVLNSIKGAGKKAGNAGVAALETGIGAAGNAKDSVRENVGKAAHATGDRLSREAQQVRDDVRWAAGKVSDGLDSAIERGMDAQERLDQKVGEVGERISNRADKVLDGIAAAPGKVKENLKPEWNRPPKKTDAEKGPGVIKRVENAAQERITNARANIAQKL